MFSVNDSKNTLIISNESNSILRKIFEIKRQNQGGLFIRTVYIRDEVNNMFRVELRKRIQDSRRLNNISNLD